MDFSGVTLAFPQPRTQRKSSNEGTEWIILALLTDELGISEETEEIEPDLEDAEEDHPASTTELDLEEPDIEEDHSEERQ